MLFNVIDMNQIKIIKLSIGFVYNNFKLKCLRNDTREHTLYIFNQYFANVLMKRFFNESVNFSRLSLRKCANELVTILLPNDSVWGPMQLAMLLPKASMQDTLVYRYIERWDCRAAYDLVYDPRHCSTNR